MEETVSSAFMTGVDLLLCAALLIGVAVLFQLSYNASAVLSEQQLMTDSLKEYREYNQYDGTVVYPQDVLATIYRYRGSPYVAVVDGTNHYLWSENVMPAGCTWNTASIASFIDQSKMYKSTVVKGLNGDILGFEFQAIN